MHAHEKAEMRNLTEARRRVNAELRTELSVEERARRVAEYARQVELYGEIVAYLPPTEPRRPAYRSRFAAHGDVLRPRNMSTAKGGKARVKQVARGQFTVA